ncbi:hypothetical protein [Halorientalis halophila]|uniref:hypothetical protein n=1 Tax=Halorientalis halophila TaxID=3108499 RepID=UPI00300BBAC2
MGLFDSVRGLVSGDAEPADDDGDGADGERPDPTPTTFRNKAADAVADWDAYELDFSLDSLSRLDRFAAQQGAKLDVMHEEGDESVADLHTRYTIQAGSYLGEVLVRERDGEWVENGDTWAVAVERDGEPVTVDVFELAGHAFAEDPVFGEVADRFTDGDGDPEPDEPDDEPATVDADGFAAEAEELAALWDDYDLDFSPRSLARLDRLADAEWDASRFADAELGGEDMDSGMFTELVKQLGSYYGEVLVRSLDAEWTRKDGDPVVAVEGNTNAPAIPVSVFSVAADSLTGPAVFATRFNELTDRANLEVPDVATTAGVTPSTETPAATDREDEELTAVTPDDPAAPGAEETDADGDETSGGNPDGSAGVAPPEVAESAGSDEPDALAEAATGGGPTDVDTEPDGSDTDDSTTEEDSYEGNEGESDATGEEADTATDVEDQSPLETAIAETVAAGVVDRSDEDGESAAGAETADPAGGTDDPETGETQEAETDASEPEDEEREALAAEISDGAPAESGPTLPSPDELQDDAEAFAATYPGYDLDFSPDSLSRLDELVAEEYDAAAFAGFSLDAPNSQFQIDRVTEAGGYFALVIEATVGGEWERTEEGLQFVVEGATGVARLDPLGVAAGCFRGDDSFAATYAAIRDRLNA